MAGGDTGGRGGHGGGGHHAPQYGTSWNKRRRTGAEGWGPSVQDTVNPAKPWVHRSLCPLLSLCQAASALTPLSHGASLSAEDAPARIPLFLL